MANKAISELPQAQNVNNQDLFVLEQSGIAKKLTAETFITEQGIIDALAEALDGHGGISSVTLSSVSGRIRTYLITFTDETTTTFQVLDGTSIDRIEKTSTAGLVDTYTIFMSDGTTSFFQVTNGSKGDPGGPTDEQVTTAVNTWLGANVAQETGYVLDSSLSMSNAAAPADLVGDLKSTLEQDNNKEVFLTVADFKQGGYGRDGRYNSSTGVLVTTINPIPDWVDEIIISNGFTGIMFIFDSNNTYYGGTYSDYVISGGYYNGNFYFTNYFNFNYFRTAYKNLSFYLCVKRTSGANLNPSNMTGVVKLTKKIKSENINSYEYGFSDSNLIGNNRKDFIISIGHGGGNASFPFNTAPNYIEAAKNGLLYVEGDITYTSDDVPVLCHDRTINGQARNPDGTVISSTIYIADITYAQANEYDWGIYKGSQFAGTKLLRFDEWVLLCKQLSLVPCIELKRDSNSDPDIHSQARINNLVSILKSHNMQDKCMWASFDKEAMFRVKKAIPNADTGIAIIGSEIRNTVKLDTAIDIIRGLRYFGGMSYATVDKDNVTQAFLTSLENAGIPLIEYFINSTTTALAIKDHAPLFGGYTDYAIDIGGTIKNSILES